MTIDLTFERRIEIMNEKLLEAEKRAEEEKKRAEEEKKRADAAEKRAEYYKQQVNELQHPDGTK